MLQRYIALFLGLLFNALGSGLTVATNMGTSPWTASEVNLGHMLGISVGWPIFMVGAITAVVNQFLIGKWDATRFIGGILFVSFFSYFTDIFVSFFTDIGVPQLSIISKIILCLVGTVIFCSAISLYQRANIIMHPNDDTTNIIRFRFFKGKVVQAQIVNFLAPTIIIVITVFITHKIYSVNIGTLFCMFFTGPFIGLADKYIWPKLHHNFRIQAHKN
jgi:uncharacterized membrane protein YczE